MPVFTNKQKDECQQQTPLQKFAVTWDEMDESSAEALKQAKPTTSKGLLGGCSNLKS